MKILVIGEVFLDENVVGISERLSPESPVPILTNCKTTEHLGGAANVAKNISSLGCDVSLLTLFADDIYGREIKNKLSNYNVSIINSNTFPTKTIRKIRYLVKNQQLLRQDIEEKFDKLSSEYITNLLYSICQRFDMIVISDYNKGLLSTLVTNRLKSIKPSLIILLDSKSVSKKLIDGSTLYKPNSHEFNQIIGNLSNELTNDLTSINDKINIFYENFSPLNLLLTLGDEGSILVINSNGNKQQFNLPVYKRDVYDVTGAGDTVLSVLAVCLAQNISLEDSAKRANYIASKSVMFQGTYTPTKQDLIDSSCLKIFTNGCFDVLHLGHIKLLKYSKSLGTKLIIGLNSDESVRRLKGESRPYNTVSIRKEILENIKHVDEVIIFDEDTPYELIKKIQPNIIVKGGDYEQHSVVGKDIVESMGGRVEIFPYIEHYSTTLLSNKIINNQ
ncbi:PfkB family carbohydrate kinase [Prochlorococcus marinus]|uniref:PfkB family carbohydrate kinase n=1 Tax=Prochlorococcus marinus TaxID=1219 RepID=UPI0022B4501E|nr:PfkB family carbohydrate kinase [Prochlorococcus marinus]